MAELLAGKDRGEVHLNNRYTNRGDSIADNHRCMGIATGIKHNAIVAAIGTLQPIYNLALDIRLIVVESMLRVAIAKSSEDILEALRTVYLGLALPQKIEVRPVDNQNFHRKIGLVR